MKKPFLFLSFVCAISLNPIAFADNGNPKTRDGFEYPNVATVIDDNSKIAITCKESKTNGGIITCTFNQVVVRHADTKSSVDSLNKLKNTSDREIQDGYKKFCQHLDEDHGLNNRLADQYKAAKSDEERKSSLYFKNVCANPSRITVTKWQEDELQKAQTTCTIFSNTYSQTFQYKVDSDQWISQEGPSPSELMNDCGMIIISYLKQDSRKGWGFSWNYITRKIVTNKTGHFFGSSCSELAKGKDSVEKENISYGAYSNLVENTPFMNCRYIDFASTF